MASSVTYHSVHVNLSHFLNEFDGGTLSVLLVKLSIGADVLIGKLANGLLKSTVAVLVVGRLETFADPGSFGVRNGRESSVGRKEVTRFLTFDGSDDVATVLVEYFSTVHSEEGFSGIYVHDERLGERSEPTCGKKR
jgi:hypothetical protein